MAFALLLPVSPALTLPRPPADPTLAWPPQAVLLLQTEYQHRGDSELAERLSARTGYAYDVRQVEHRRHALGLHRTQPQVVAIMERNRQDGRGRATTRRRQPEGTEYTRYEEGRPVRYVRAGGRAQPLAVHVWQQAHGAVPESHIVTFHDANPLNCTLGNLYLMSRADNAARNRNNEKAAGSRREYHARRHEALRAEYLRLHQRATAVTTRLALLRSGARDEQYSPAQTGQFVADLEREEKQLRLDIFRLPDSVKGPVPTPPARKGRA